jgi:hypothetical protein
MVSIGVMLGKIKKAESCACYEVILQSLWIPGVHPHRQIKRPAMLCQRPNRNKIHARFCITHQCFIRNIPRSFQFGFAFGERYCFADFIEAEVVQHDDVGTGVEGLLQFFEVFYFYFYFDRFAGGDFVCAGNRVGDAAAGGDVVFFNQECVV